MNSERPSNVHRPPRIEQSTYQAGLPWPIVIAIVLILAALATVFLLPDWMQESASESRQLVAKQTVPDSQIKNSEAISTAAPNTASAAIDSAKREAEADLANALEARARLENQRADSWARQEVMQIMQILGQGDDALGRQRYAQASGFYKNAISKVDRLLASKPSRLADSLSTAKSALANEASRDSGPQALRALNTALSIQPDHELARAMLARAEVREQVQGRFSEATQAVKEADLAKAAELLGQVLKLDAEFGLAKQLQVEVLAQQRALGFKQRLSAGLNALDRGEIKTAQQAFKQASALLGKEASSDDVKALKQANVALRNARVGQQLKQLRQQAERAEAAEEWSAAIKFYKQAKALDGAANFAQSGLQRTTELKTLNQQIRHYLQRPERLNSSEPLNNARQVLKNAQALDPKGKKTQAQVTRLQALLQEASHPVTVTLQSDGDTEVLIQYLGRIGTFTQHKHSLVPGTYTFIGSRVGYRDVRITRRIESSDSNPVIQIRCEEPV